MSFTKRGMDDDNKNRAIAVSILLAVDYFERCEYHEEVIYQTYGELEEAYKYGNANWEKNGYSEVFESRREMTDAIKSVAEDPDYGNDQCERCAVQDAQ